MNSKQSNKSIPRPIKKQEEEDLLEIREETAKFGLLKLIAFQLGQAGFTHVEHRSLVEDLEGLLSGFLDGITQLSYEFAQLSNRSRPNAWDMIAACSDQGIEVHHFNELLSIQSDLLPDYKIEKITRNGYVKSRDPTLDFLPSDPESDEEEERNRGMIHHHNLNHKRQGPNSEQIGGLPHLPPLPAKHAWIYTPLKPAPATVIPPEHLSTRRSIPKVPTTTTSTTTMTTELPMRNLLVNEFLRTDGDETDDPNVPACLGYLNRRIRDTRLVEQSLTNLVQPNSIISSNPPLTATTTTVPQLSEIDSTSPPPKLLVSHTDIPIVNFERDWFPAFPQ
ncbi:hypothetical protein MJO28_008316 [Puccinia striiformis f. sp. tritici]|uniref:Transcription initiation factor TFIID subunit 8 n=3 Tax=Puccinia striiformis TaxID=27350 RepID=A0A0L0V385_9BASI|nr:hypothetical protein Pst134EA_015608 [Puccinia striiformis f. sp. tritici]KAI9602662.1 hypothetical protein H4Q26_001954 [Puccinia striiformis f. sp. tritici PST-130]KNE93758.1 hypothetical protein PSTG_12861 [Puccinia striiformis f. sp. tritici PST-78]POW09965.1 hypothetical protein PSTT_06457 [Puccinia striiformis]KAH9452767.1 hypothetical protein Pst134EB_016721 [Puccinia striiformis f. sp. tritici]KAH9463518.1 hypothetical protein Pst134EA_015608 [Puccinia striiformis f. sp. tritici]